MRDRSARDTRMSDAIFRHGISGPLQEGREWIRAPRGGAEAEPHGGRAAGSAPRASDPRAPLRDAGRVPGNPVQDGTDESSLSDRLFESRLALVRTLADGPNGRSRHVGSDHGKVSRRDKAEHSNVGRFTQQVNISDVLLLVSVGVFAFGVFSVWFH